MRRLATAILLFLIASVGFGQPEEEVFREVMATFVLRYPPPHLKDSKSMTVVILTRPNHEIKLQTNDFGRFKQQCQRLDRSTFENFLSTCHLDFKSPNDSIQNVTIVMIDKTEFIDYKALYDKYVDFEGRLLEFTNVAFNSTGDQALVYFGSQGGGVGGGVYLLYSRKRARWKLIKTFGAWAA